MKAKYTNRRNDWPQTKNETFFSQNKNLIRQLIEAGTPNEEETMKIVPPPEEEGDFIYSDFPTNLRDLVQTDNAKHEISEGIPGQRKGHENTNTCTPCSIKPNQHFYPDYRS